MWYVKAVVTATEITKATTTAFWNKVITNYGFSKKLLADQGHNFESELIKELYKLANIWKVQMTPYHPETNDQCERFNQTLISMIGTKEAKDKLHWNEYLPTIVHAYNWTKTNAMDFSLHYLMYRQKPRLQIDTKFGLALPQADECCHNKFIPTLYAG